MNKVIRLPQNISAQEAKLRIEAELDETRRFDWGYHVHGWDGSFEWLQWACKKIMVTLLPSEPV